MTTNLPADIELSFPYRGLVAQLGVVHAAYVFQRIWCDLAFQTRVHGKSGVYGATYMPKFEESVGATVPNALQALLDCGMLLKMDSGDYLCRIFNSYNPHLDAGYVPDTSKWMRDWHDFRKAMLDDKGPKMIKKLPQAAWYLPNGTVIAEKTMNKGITLICSLDVILHRQNRKPEEISIGALHAAADIVTRLSDAKVSAILRRFMSMSRPRLNPCLPPTTEEALAHWDDLVAAIYPDEGFESWIKRVNADHRDEKETEESRASAIADELASLAGV